MIKLKNKLLGAIAPATVLTISVVSVSCGQNVQTNLNANEFKVNFNDKKKELETFFKSYDFDKLFAIYTNQTLPKGMLKTYDILFQKYDVFAKKIIKFLEGIAKDMPDKKEQIDSIVSDINTRLKNAADENERRNYIDYLINGISTVFQRIPKDSYKNEELIKERDELVSIVEGFNTELAWATQVILEKLVQNISKTYYDDKNESINMLIKSIQEDFKKAENSTSISNEQIQTLQQRRNQFAAIFGEIFPKIREKFKKGEGLVSYRTIPNTRFIFDFDDLSKKGNDGILISPKDENKVLENALISDVGILYIPNNENKLNRVDINFQAIINRYEKMLADLDKSTEPEDKKQASKADLNNQIAEYKMLWENYKNPTKLDGNRLISSKLNVEDLKGKYILRITATFTPRGAQPIPVRNFAISNIKINKETKKIELSQFVSDGSNNIVPNLYSRFIAPIAAPREPFAIDYYIPVDAKEFNDVFLGGKTPMDASKSTDSLDLSIKKIIKINIE